MELEMMMQAGATIEELAILCEVDPEEIFGE